VGDRHLIALTGAPGRFVRAPADRLEHAAHLGWMVGDPKFETNHGGHPAACPHRAPEALGFGAPVQQVGQASQLFAGQPPGSAGRWLVAQRLRTSRAGTCHPLADRPFADAQGFGDLALGPAPLLELPGLAAAAFFPVLR
jgi:hypothetical protein